MPACDFGDDRSGYQRLFKNPGQVIGTPPPSAYRPGNHLEAAHLALRLKSMVKPRHKTIPPNQGRQSGRSTRAKEGAVGTPLTIGGRSGLISAERQPFGRHAQRAKAALPQQLDP